MKRLFVVLFALLVLVACDSTEVDNEVTEDENEEIEADIDGLEEFDITYEQKMEILLADHENISIELFKVRRLTNNIDDYVLLQVAMTNKQNKTYDIYIKDLKVDGEEIDSLHIWIDDDEIEPNEILVTFINGYGKELTIEEHVAGKLVIRDYDGNREEIEFSEYINE